MALQGTIKDFALPDIFQLIGIQRKTGVLTLENGQDSVSVKFLDGQVVDADTRSETVEDRLGTLLVRTGRITQEQLVEALRSQKNTMQRLGHVLVSAGYISEQDLIEALRVQSTQIIYRLFRWRDGTYRFIAVEDLDYDQRHFRPISSETILMEGARMIDEWPIIERRVRSPQMLLRRTADGEAAQRGLPAIPTEGSFDIDRPAGASGSEAPAAVELSPEEARVLNLVDGRRRVDEVCDLSGLGEFDAYRLLSEMLRRGLVEEVRRDLEAAPGDLRGERLRRLQTWGIRGLLIVLSCASVMTLRHNPVTPWRLMEEQAASDQIRVYASLARLERIEKAIQVSYLDTGVFPPSLAVLAQHRYVDARDLQDAWGRPFFYRLSANGYLLHALDEAGRPSSELSLSRTFSAAQRMLLAGAGAASP